MIRFPALEKVIAGLLVMAAFGIGVVILTGEGLIRLDPVAKSAPSAGLTVPPDPMEPAALAALEAFFEAPDLDSKASQVRDPVRVKPMMEDLHQRRGHPFPTLGRVSTGREVSFEGTPMVLFEVEPFSGPRYPVAVAWDGGRFAVDWESLTAYGTMDWGEFIELRPAAAQTLRVYLTTAGPADGIPGTPGGYVTFRIEHRDHPQPVSAIAGPALAATLKPLLARGRTPLTLEAAWSLSGPGDVPTLEILKLVSLKWSP